LEICTVKPVALGVGVANAGVRAAFRGAGGGAGAPSNGPGAVASAGGLARTSAAAIVWDREHDHVDVKPFALALMHARTLAPVRAVGGMKVAVAAPGIGTHRVTDFFLTVTFFWVSQRKA
jgi:hypothetical protein